VVGGLVEQHRVGAREEDARELDAAALAARERLERLVDDFLARYAAAPVRDTAPYPGVLDVLDALAPRPLAVCTNKPYDATMEILKALDLAGYFDAVVGGDSLPGIKKPDAKRLKALNDCVLAPVMELQEIVFRRNK